MEENVLLLLKELVDILLETREEDLEKIEIANESFNSIEGYVQKLGKNVKAFSQVFQVNEQGFFTGFSLGTRIRRKEHLRLAVFFLDRGVSGVKGKMNAQASRVKVRPMSLTSAVIKGYQIKIYFDAPTEVKVNARTYNKWLSENLEGIMSNNAVRSSYVHEFTHVQDFKRMDPRFLLQRGNQKVAEKEKGAPTNFGAYANDPLELNAYYSQAMSDVQNQLKAAKTPEERLAVIGSSAQEFVDSFMNSYLKKQVRKNISPENWKRLAKRAATGWEHLNQ